MPCHSVDPQPLFEDKSHSRTLQNCQIDERVCTAASVDRTAKQLVQVALVFASWDALQCIFVSGATLLRLN